LLINRVSDNVSGVNLFRAHCGVHSASDQIGTLALELEADIIALDEDPLKDITVVRRIVFVMKDGVVW
jgi:imidazolonepropionase-like amidohydrolase